MSYSFFNIMLRIEVLGVSLQIALNSGSLTPCPPPCHGIPRLGARGY